MVYFSPPKTVIVHAKDNTPIVQAYYLKNVLSQHPTYRDGWVQLAKIEYELGNREEMQNAIAKVKELDPTSKDLDSLQNLLSNK